MTGASVPGRWRRGRGRTARHGEPSRRRSAWRVRHRRNRRRVSEFPSAV